ncbi:MAG TPA: DUF2513 domain-containing protein [Thermoanaerobaculia bacterium]|nr:DUF2513 domain-containing protein [Thermoanaerobaculia bacterium]
MKRDFNLIRKIILTVEDGPTGFTHGDVIIDGYSHEEIGYHSYLIIDSGLAEGFDATNTTDTSPDWRIHNLTAAGHDFADAARSDTTWNKATGMIKDKAGGVTLDILKQLLFALVRSQFGL